MAKADVTLKKSYAVKSGDVVFSLTIGEGQHGTSAVFLDHKRLLVASGPIGGLRLGAGADVKGKTLVVHSVVNDVVSTTNRMSVTYRLKGGSAAASFTAKGKVAEEGDLLIFEAEFELKS